MLNTQIKDIVRHKLIKDIRTRDNDNLLASLIWFDELKSKGLEEVSAFGFLKMYSTGSFMNYESIRRCRQKIQELEPSLRGQNYEERKRKDKEVKDQIKNF